MDRHALVRWTGVAAIAGGALRGVTALLPAAQTPAIHLTYLAIDLLLLLAVAGLFIFQRERTGGWGALGALLAVLGAGLLIIDDLFSPTFALYPIAALHTLVVLSGVLLAAGFVSAGVYLYAAPVSAP
jgi:drug/metabolite transporter (DMT)-like permease